MLHVEKVASERIFGREHDVWDVHTDKERWWVVTGPTNLYSQSLMPSLDYTLSFHATSRVAKPAEQRNYPLRPSGDGKERLRRMSDKVPEHCPTADCQSVLAAQQLRLRVGCHV